MVTQKNNNNWIWQILIAVGLAILPAAVSYGALRDGVTNNKVAIEKLDINKANRETEDLKDETIKEDIKDIKTDLKQILKLVRENMNGK